MAHSENKFKLGDKVIYSGEPTTIIGVHNINKDYYIVYYSDGWYGRELGHPDYSNYNFGGTVIDTKRLHYVGNVNCLTPIGKREESKKNVPIVQIKKERKTLMSSIIDIARNITRSADDKLLIKHRLLNEDGSYTSLAIEVIMQEVCKEKKDLLVKFANIAEEESIKK